MIDSNPLIIERNPVKAADKASSEEIHYTWYHVVDKYVERTSPLVRKRNLSQDIDRITYFPGYHGRVGYDVSFHNLKDGLQTHTYAPLGLDIRNKWTLGGTLPHEPHEPKEPKEPTEIGLEVPRDGLWLREDVDMKCNFIATSFVKKTLKKAHESLVERLVEKAHIRERETHNSRQVRVRTNRPHKAPSNSVDPLANLLIRTALLRRIYTGPWRKREIPSLPMIFDVRSDRLTQGRYQGSRNPHQAYQPHQPVELPQAEFGIARLLSSEIRHG
ncbi:MAG: hypothetical protein Q9206_001672 [Seirophora lacunosa]